MARALRNLGEEQLKISYRTDLGHLSLIANVSGTFSRYEVMRVWEGGSRREKMGVSSSLGRLVVRLGHNQNKISV